MQTSKQFVLRYCSVCTCCFVIMLKILFIFSVFLHIISCECISNNNDAKTETFKLVYEWKFVNFTWPSPKVYEKSVSNGEYVPGNIVMLGVKYYKDKFYLAMPKIKKGSPVTLAYIHKIPKHGNYKDPLLIPYPNWITHTGNDCETTLQNLQSMEIDNEGIMWIIDGRRIDKTDHKCPPKIVLLDLNNQGQMVQSYVVPNEVCSHESCALNDLVLDDADGGYAYITDSSVTDPGLIIYSRRQNRAWKVRDDTMFAEEAARNFTAHGIVQPGRNNINGIALQQKSTRDGKRLLYYTAQSAFAMYSIDTQLLRNESLAKTELIHKNIVNVGNKTAQSAGMIVDSAGYLYYGIMTEDAVYRWDTKKPLSTQELIEKNPELIPWPDSYTFDKSGYLYLLASNVDRFSAGKLTRNDYNFKLLNLCTGTDSYLN